ncbi:MAG TPA: right-handed parallel beta-helix repeat-containing protein [Gemmatimonadales bacterium]|nr:right-handed parallel beta-helix repeat-containing protein [Gemmatimonadales bacterium]
MAIRQWVAVLASVVPLAGCADPKLGRPASALADPVGYTQPPATNPRNPPAVRFYVDPKGMDSNPGTGAAPFKTIQRAADTAGPGDTVVVRAGRYTGPSRIVSLSRGGAPGEWLTFRSEQLGGAVLDGRNGESQEAWYFGPQVAYVRVEGFEITGLQEHGFDTYGGGVHDLLIARNHVHHIGRNCTDTSNGRTGASLGEGTHRVTFDGNVWHDIGRFAPGESGCTPANQNYQNHDHAIYVADANEITITNNVFYNLARGWAVHRYFSRGSPSHGLTIVNNTFAGQNPYRPGQIILATPTSGLRIENNIFYGPQEAALYFEDLDFPGAAVRNNMIYQGVTKVGRPTGVSFGKNWEKTDPRIAGGTDFHLRSDSPAIDVGLPNPQVTHDADGVTRPRGAGYDLGAYEH